MKEVFITLDYELFFGEKAGSYQNSIIQPTEALLSILDKHNIKASFFVDAGYIVSMQKYKHKYPHLEKEYENVTSQVKLLAINGHDIQLHIHPHWEDSFYDEIGWNMNTSRYRLDSFSDEEIVSIVKRYKDVIEDITGKKTFTFRAGGWCIQPFNRLEKVFKKEGIWLDSTVFKNGYNHSSTHYFDFRKSPDKDIWKFENDPLITNTDGYFTEIPIASYRVSPLFFWNFALKKLLGGKEHNSYGDGSPAGGSRKDKIRMLTKYSNTVVSIDGFKSYLLEKAFKKFKGSYFVVIGHPKALSSYSLKKLDDFISKNKNFNYLTYSKWAEKNETGRSK